MWTVVIGYFVVAIVVLFGIPLLKAMAKGLSDNVPAPYDGPSQKGSTQEVTRLASASGILLGSAYRRMVIERGRDKHHACAPELGLDFETVLMVCRWAEDRQIRYDFAIGAGAILSATLFSVGALWLAGLAVAVMFGTVLRKRFEERFRLAGQFRRKGYEPLAIKQRFHVTLSNDERRGLPRLDQNLWAYSGFSPFDGAGFEVGGWSFVVDSSRPNNVLGMLNTLRPFQTNEILQAVEGAVGGIGHRGLLCRDYVVLHGSNLPNVAAAESGIWRTVQHVESSLFEVLQDGEDDRLRHYKWIQLHDWGSELVVSSFLFCSRVSDEVYIECRHHLLTALAPEYRKVDALTNSTWWTGLRWSFARVLLAPLDVALSLCWLIYRPLAALPRLLKIQDLWDRMIMADEPRYNFGGAISLRQAVAGRLFTHYFQKTDKQMLEKLIDKRILDSLVDFFESHGVDTSEIKERQSTILNNGIIVQGGDVKAQTMAVGRGARASGVFGKMARRRQANVKSA